MLSPSRPVVDAPFFAEWERRAPASNRSLSRALALYRVLGWTDRHCPCIGIVGSKGKGSAALAAVAALHAAGLRVVSLTSPALFDNRERVRIDGVPISAAEYSACAARVADAIASLPAPNADEYLSPNGAFLAAALLTALRPDVDALVVEAGMGGAQDELSLLQSDVVVVTSIFGEHLARLGATVEEIAREKAGVIVAPHQRVIIGASASAHASTFRQRADAVGAHVLDRDVVPAVDDLQLADVVPFGENLAIGMQAGMWLARASFGRSVDVDATVRAVRAADYPGRGSHHIDSLGRRWMLDAAISEDGVRRALAWADARFHAPYAVIACVPDGKDVNGVRAALRGRASVHWCAVDEPTLSTRISADAAGEVSLPHARDVIARLTTDRCLVVGTWSFLSEVGALLGLQGERARGEAR